MDAQIPDATPAVLADLIAAGLVSHEMIGDPARLAGEAAALRALCALVGGTVYRLGAFHYAFRAGPGDLDGRLAGLARGDWTAVLETALQAVLGADAAWLNPAGLLGGGDPALDLPLLLLRAHETAVAAGLAAAPAGVRAVVDAAYAAETARLIAGAAPGSDLAARLAAIEARQADLADQLLAREAAEAVANARLSEALAGLAERIEARAAREERTAARLEEIATGESDFEARLGLTLAEVLARLEQGASPRTTARVRAPAGQEA
jgi:hypothetical protein